MKIAIAGFQHETNTFSEIKTTYQDFVQADSWPEMVCGEQLLTTMDAQSIPISGFISEALKDNATLLPILWCSATPSGIVEQSAYDQIYNQIMSGLAKCENFDAIYLDLHGAMVTEDLEDAEGFLLKKIREAYPKTPIVVSLDYHANVSKEMVEFADALVAYRTYPHVDMVETGQKSYRILKNIVAGNKKEKAFAKLPFLVPMTSQSTLAKPCRSIFQEIAEYEKSHSVEIVFALGFPLSDIHDVGPSLIVYAENKFQSIYHSAREGVFKAKELIDNAILVDTQDNPGCGGSGDTTGLLHEMIKQKLPDGLMGVLCDEVIAREAHKSGVGTLFQAELGAKVFTNGIEPIAGKFKVLVLSQGKFTATGPFYKNVKMDLGLMALLEIEGVHVLVSSRKAQAADRAMFEHMGVCLEDYRILALKSSVHYQADFNSFSIKQLIVESPGFNIADIKKLTYQYKPEGVICL